MGIIYHDGQYYGGGSGGGDTGIEVTQAELDALSPAEKKDKTFFVTDGIVPEDKRVEALEDKVGNAELVTEAKDLSGAVNEINENLTSKTGMATVSGIAESGEVRWVRQGDLVTVTITSLKFTVNESGKWLEVAKGCPQPKYGQKGIVFGEFNANSIVESIDYTDENGVLYVRSSVKTLPSDYYYGSFTYLAKNV